MIVPSLLLVLGLALMFAPRVFAVRSEATRLRRLQEIKEGGSEKYFEEQRDLLAYKPSQRFLLLWRVIGAAVAVAAAIRRKSLGRAKQPPITTPTVRANDATWVEVPLQPHQACRVVHQLGDWKVDHAPILPPPAR